MLQNNRLATVIKIRNMIYLKVKNILSYPFPSLQIVLMCPRRQIRLIYSIRRTISKCNKVCEYDLPKKIASK